MTAGKETGNSVRKAQWIAHFFTNIYGVQKTRKQLLAEF